MTARKDSPVRIRGFQLADMVDLAKAASQGFLEMCGRHDFVTNRAVVPYLTGSVDPADDWFIVADYEDARAVGSLVGQAGNFWMGASASEADNRNCVSLVWASVHPDYWGKGIGGRLIEAFEEKARKGKFTTEIVRTYFAQTFYEMYGFTRVETFKALALEIVGRGVAPPPKLEIRPLLLDDLPPLANHMTENAYGELLVSFFHERKLNAFGPERGETIIGRLDGSIAGVAFGLTSSEYPDLLTLTYLFAREPEFALELLQGLVYLGSLDGRRWVGVNLPLQDIDESELMNLGWKEAQLPTFATLYELRKDL